MASRSKRKKSPELPDPTNPLKRTKNNLLDEESSLRADSSALRRLLDFSDLHESASIRQRFDTISSTLLHDFTIVVQTVLGSGSDFVETRLQIMEMEFYFWNSTYHRDPFTHGSQEQKTAGQWYFHRTPRRSDDSTQTLISTSGYRGGTRKGLDLTISGITPTESRYFPSSSSHPDAYGGVLLRTLRDLNSGKIISGPSLLVDHILQLSGAERIPELVENHWANDTNAFNNTCLGERKTCMFLCPSPNTNTALHIYKSPRIGLDLSHPGTTASPTHPRVEFISQPYRYFVHPERLTANGRAQTLLGVLPQKELSGLKDKTVNAYLAEYQAGMDRKAKLEEFVGARGKGVSSSPTKYMKLMGCIESLKAGRSAAGDDDGAN
ncbi:uncharacterized protein BT62DRAFT_930883 [Guyanagaster necrorhizus]|uniref:Uncharacterized protein n=1 Tax=Guyanagaster necrorhizus TaxID=856835 RepID=A0A9P8AUA4_9AGAR|nr:uncharacterized protein BT62DRAFT_930883 [Guyanagaster necrorhizus MCA 3950]KAG7447831.1 hypothetical protein BT62DRAFT_930883 [Guyanagaster necrorhizus MCA 3950]